MAAPNQNSAIFGFYRRQRSWRLSPFWALYLYLPWCGHWRPSIRQREKFKRQSYWFRHDFAKTRCRYAVGDRRLTFQRHWKQILSAPFQKTLSSKLVPWTFSKGSVVRKPRRRISKGLSWNRAKISRDSVGFCPHSKWLPWFSPIPLGFQGQTFTVIRYYITQSLLHNFAQTNLRIHRLRTNSYVNYVQFWKFVHNL